MTYTTRDKSVSNGAPIECYKFVAPHKTWYLTSHAEQQTLGGNIYTPTPITRTALEVGAIIDTAMTVDFNVPSTHELALHFCYALTPRELIVTVYRFHDGDDPDTQSVIQYEGEAVSFTAAGKWATIQTGSKLQSRLNNNVGTAFYQRMCNHTLYDDRCQADRELHTSTTTVKKIQGQLITVNNDGYANNELDLGEMTNTRTGEKQGIIDNIDNKIRVGVAFIDLVVGDEVELTQGCDHVRLGHCKTRFDNVVHYGGFDFIPEGNPYKKLSGKSSTNTKKNVTKDRVTEVAEPTPPRPYFPGDSSS